LASSHEHITTSLSFVHAQATIERYARNKDAPTLAPALGKAKAMLIEVAMSWSVPSS
jgi:hypothetical protein